MRRREEVPMLGQRRCGSNEKISAAAVADRPRRPGRAPIGRAFHTSAPTSYRNDRSPQQRDRRHLRGDAQRGRHEPVDAARSAVREHPEPVPGRHGQVEVADRGGVADEQRRPGRDPGREVPRQTRFEGLIDRVDDAVDRGSRAGVRGTPRAVPSRALACHPRVERGGEELGVGVDPQRRPSSGSGSRWTIGPRPRVGGGDERLARPRRGRGARPAR